MLSFRSVDVISTWPLQTSFWLASFNTASVNVYVGYNYTINNANWDLTDDPNGSYDGVGYDVGEITKVNYITINGNKYYDGYTINLDVVDVADDCEMTLHLGLYDSSDFQN